MLPVRHTHTRTRAHTRAAAAAAAKALQSCPTLCDPIDGSPPGSAVPGILQARTLEWVAISFSSTHTYTHAYTHARKQAREKDGILVCSVCYCGNGALTRQVQRRRR